MAYRASDDELAEARSQSRWSDVARILTQRIDAADGATKRELLRELIDVQEHKFANVPRAIAARRMLAEADPGDLVNVEALAGHLRTRREWAQLVETLDHLASRVDPELQAPLLDEMIMVCRDRLGDTIRADAIAARRARLG
jgi:hypothetical protein